MILACGARTPTDDRLRLTVFRVQRFYVAIDSKRAMLRLCGLFVGAVRQFRAPDVKVGLRDRLIPAEAGDALSARGMPCQVIAPGRFFRGLKFLLVDVPLRAQQALANRQARR